MNYRHAFHAGNFADVFKHLILSRIIEHLKKKEKAFRVIDTHAGAGRYDLPPRDQLSANGKPPEWVGGIGRLTRWEPAGAIEPIVKPYLDGIDLPEGEYPKACPGSPLLALNLMRKQDRLSACELHPDAFGALKQLFAGNYQVRTLNLDGWLLPNSQIPPKEKRGVLMIDPPFEEPDDFAKLTDAMVTTTKRWSGGTVALWYPLKHGDQVARFKAELTKTGVSDLVAYEIDIARPETPPKLYGCGMIVRKGPYTLENEMKAALPFLAERLEERPGSGAWRIERLVAE